jgi:hypothetical protein
MHGPFFSLSFEPSAFSVNVIDGKASLMHSHFYYVEKLLVRFLTRKSDQNEKNSYAFSGNTRGSVSKEAA